MAGFVEALEAMGPVAPDDYEAFWGQLEVRHGDLAKALEDAIDGSSSSTHGSSVYAAKRATLQLSLDVDMAYSGQLFVAWMNFVVQMLGDFKPARVLDAGADDGLLACFYATLWPECEVVAQDLTARSASLCAELAERLGISSRITFESADLTASGCFGDAQYDLVTASRVLLGESVPRVRGGQNLSMESATGIDLKSLDRVLSNLLSATRPDGGQLLVLDRIANPAEASVVAKAVAGLGGFVDWSRSARIPASELQGADQLFPVLVIGKTQGGPELSHSDGALALFAQDELAGLETVYTGNAAEALAASMDRRELLFSARMTDYSFGEATVTAYEVWRCGPLILSYQSDAYGQRNAQLVSAIWQDAWVERLRSDLEANDLGLDLELGCEPVLAATNHASLD